MPADRKRAQSDVRIANPEHANEIGNIVMNCIRALKAEAMSPEDLAFGLAMALAFHVRQSGIEPGHAMRALRKCLDAPMAVVPAPRGAA